MAFGVTAFKSNLYNSTNGGGARPSLFEVDIAANTGNTDFSKADNLLVKAAAIPGRTINPVTVNWFGRAYKFTGNSTYDIWTVTIMNDEDFSHRNEILNWMREISGSLDGSRTSALGGVTGGAAVGTATVTQINADATQGQQWEFKNMWPSSLGEIAVDWSNDAVQEYTIGFAYDYFTKSIGGTKQGADNTQESGNTGGETNGVNTNNSISGKQGTGNDIGFGATL